MPAGGNTSNINWDAIPDEAEKSISSLVDESLSGRLPANKKEMIMAQIRHETGRGELDSNVAKKNNNVSGITWNKNFPPNWKGTARPSAEGGYYVHFPTINDWADKHLEILRKDSGAGAPLDADNVSDFAKRLKKNGYYTAPETEYVAGMQSMMDKYGKPESNIDWNSIPDEAGDVPSVEKKSPDVSANGSVANSPNGPGDFSQSDWSQPHATVDGAPTQGVSVGTNTHETQPNPIAKPNSQPLSAQEVNNKVLGTNVDGSPVAPIDQQGDVTNNPREKTAAAADVLAKDVMQNAHDQQMPEYLKNFGVTSFDQPGNIAHDISDPHGNPEVTGQYNAHRVAQLSGQRDQELNALEHKYPLVQGQGEFGNQYRAHQYAYDQEKKAIEDNYGQKINTIQDAAKHITDLQLANKEYTEKKYTPQEADDKIKQIDADFREQIAGAPADQKAELRVEQERQKADVNKDVKYNAVQLGMQQQALMGNKTAAEDFSRYQAGIPISDERKVAYQESGLNMLQSGAQMAADSGKDDVAKELAAHSDDIEGRLLKDNPKYFGKLYGAQIGSYKYNNEDNPLYGTLFSRPELKEDEIKSIGKKLGISDEKLKLVKPEYVPTMTSMPAQFGQSAINAFTFQNEKSEYGHFLTGNVPAEQHQLNNWRGITGEVSSGAGTVLGFLGQTALAGGALKGAGLLGDVVANAGKYETTANLIPLGLSNFNNAYDQSKEVIGDKPEDEGKRMAYSVINATIATALMSIDPATAIGKDALGMSSAGKDVIKMIKSEGLENISKPELQTKIQQALQAAMTTGEGTAKHTLSQAAIMGTSKAANNIVDMLFDPNHRHDVTTGVGDAALQAGVSMFIPSLFAGAQSARSNTPANKGLLWDIGSNSKEYREKVNDLYSQGKLTKDEAIQSINNINTAAGIVSAEIPRTSVVNGKELSIDQKQDYAYNLLQEKSLNDQLDKLPEHETTQRSILSSRIKELDAQRQEILTTAGDAPGYVKPIRVEEKNSESEAQPKEETPAAKKDEEKVANSEKEDIPLISDKDVTKKTTENEQQSNEREVKERGQDGTERTSTENERPNSEVQEAANDGLRNEEETSLKETPGKETELKAAPETEQPLSVKEKKKKRFQFIEEEEPAPVENKKEEKITEPEKPVENASTQSEEQQPEVLEQSGESEHARIEQAGSEITTAETENSDSIQRGAEQEKVGEVPEGFTANKSNETRKDGKLIFTKEDGDISHEMVVKNDGSAQVESINKKDFAGVDEKSKTAMADIQNFDSLEEAVKHVNEYKPADKNSEPTPERSVAPEAPSAEETPAAKEEPQEKKEQTTEDRLKQIEDNLRQQKASQQLEHKKRKQANKDKDVAAFNTHNENWHKKEAKIERLEEEKKKVIAEHRDESIKASYNSFADNIEQSYARNKERHKGEVFSSLIPGLSTKIVDPVVDFIVSRTVSGVRAAGNLHVALRATIREAKIKFPEIADEITDKEERAFYTHLEHLKETPKHEPVLPTDHEEDAKDMLADIKSGELSYEEAVKEVNDAVMRNRQGEPVSDNVADKAKAKILNYIDWHNLDKHINNIREKEEVRNAPNKIEAHKFKEGSITSEYLGAKTTKDIFGDEGFMDDLSEKKNRLVLDNVMSDVHDAVNLYNTGDKPITEWGREMLNDIKQVDNDPFKQVTALSGLHIELQSERIKSDKELLELNKKIGTTSDELTRHDLQKQRGELLKDRAQVNQMIGETQNFKKKRLSEASDVLNAGRVDRLMRNEVLFEHYEKAILSDKERKAKANLEKALSQSIVEDYRNHPEYIKERKLEDERAASKKRKEAQEQKDNEPAEKKKKNVIQRFKDRTKKSAYEKGRKEAEQDFGVNDKGEKMTAKDFLEHLKKLKNPC